MFRKFTPKHCCTDRHVLIHTAVSIQWMNTIKGLAGLEERGGGPGRLGTFMVNNFSHWFQGWLTFCLPIRCAFVCQLHHCSLSNTGAAPGNSVSTNQKPAWWKLNVTDGSRLRPWGGAASGLSPSFTTPFQWWTEPLTAVMSQPVANHPSRRWESGLNYSQDTHFSYKWMT